MLKLRLAAALVLTVLLSALVLPVLPASAAIAITTVSPDNAGNNDAAALVTVTGTGFTAGAQIKLERATTTGSPIEATGETVTGTTQVQGTLDLRDHAPGQWNATVTNPAPDNSTQTKANGFTIIAASGTSISNIAPASATKGSDVTLLINGTGLYRGGTVTVSDGNQLPIDDVTINSATFVSNTRYSVDVSIPASAADNQTFKYTSTDGQSDTQTFTTTPPVAITVTSVSPNTRGQGFIGTVIITGAGFGPAGSTPGVSFSGGDITVTGASVTNSTTISAQIKISETADTTPAPLPGDERDVTVNSGGGSGSCSACFTVVDGPTVSGISPNTTNDGAKTLTTSGAGFEGGAAEASKTQVQLEREGYPTIQISETTFTDGSPDTIVGTADLTLVAPGTYNVRVTSPTTGGSGTKANALIVGALTPTVTSLTPTSGPQGASGLSVQVNGTNFAKGDVVTFSGTGITAGTATTSTSSKITVPVTIAGTAAVGPRDVRVTHANGAVSAACVGCFAVASNNPTERFIRKTYNDLLGRDVDSSGFNYWKGILGNGTDQAKRTAFVATLLDNDEYRSRLVKEIFTRVLERTPDQAGLAFFITQLRNGVEPAGIEGSFIASDEYFTKFGGGTNTTWLNAAYPEAMGRPADNSGRAAFTAQLAAGARRDAVALTLLRSDEGYGFRIDRLFQTYLHRGTDAGGRTYWTGQFRSGIKEKVFTNLLVASNEYFATA